eukprot:SAG11_NODE_3648_length_2314_cov_1.573363_2_plen_167_part_00
MDRCSHRDGTLMMTHTEGHERHRWAMREPQPALTMPPLEELRLALNPGDAPLLDDAARAWISNVSGATVALKVGDGCFAIVRRTAQSSGVPSRSGPSEGTPDALTVAQQLILLHVALGAQPLRVRYLGFVLWRIADTAMRGVNMHADHPALAIDPQVRSTRFARQG